MALVKNDFANGLKQMPTPFGSEVVAIRLPLTVGAAGTSAYDVDDVADNDILWLGFLPANCVPVDFILDSDDADDGAGLALSVGLLNDPVAPTDLTGTAWLASSTVGQAGGAARPTTSVMSRVTATGADRAFGIKVITDPATDVAGPFELGVTLLYRAAYAAA